MIAPTIIIVSLTIAIVLSLRLGYSRGHGAGIIAGAALARRNIELENEAECVRVSFTGYPTDEPVSVSPELVMAVLPIEHNATAIVLKNLMVVAVAETAADVEKALR